MRRFKCTVCTLGSTLVLLIATIATPAVAGTLNGEIRIGMSVPLTGTFSGESSYYVNNVRLAEKEINQAGGINGKKLTMVLIDNQSTNPGALNTLNKAVEQDKVLAFIGPVKSTQILAMSDAIKQIGIVYSNEAFGSGGADAIEQYAKSQGLTVVARERFNLGDRDFTAQLLNLKRAGTEVMIPYSAGSDEGARINVQYRQLGSPYKYVGPPAVAVKAILDLSKEASEGLVGFVDSVPGMNEPNRKFVEAYKKEYNGAEPDRQAPWAYDAVYLYANAIKKVGEDRAKIREALVATKGFEGVLGTYSFTPDGEGLRGGPMAVIKNGQPVMLKMVTVAE